MLCKRAISTASRKKKSTAQLLRSPKNHFENLSGRFKIDEMTVVLRADFPDDSFRTIFNVATKAALSAIIISCRCPKHGSEIRNPD